ncbi:M20/M25/M40 family metallo-hydrolase [Brevundimonas sp. P7753]|uniref:M20/M25/M40 family metallo-hydrolase n=1 Tax=Brevundimonas sp. P7753 TaxID=2726982 RepID=UPI0015BE37C0|nr:M20/M25/M40 family metallo-hydrolase [Brevundimonas sp. P7753]NWE51611.1 M20/M25/M40 family metallo-hydrolase [Brevundimonas sp. P7753]
MRLALLFGSLTLAFLLAVWTTQVPEPRPADAPADAFSAARAMTDIEQIARAPHPVGSADHARVRAYLTDRMTQLGLSPQEQVGPLSPGAIQRLKKERGDPEAANNQAINLIGVLPGKDRSQSAVMLMAHYDTVVGSPGAADDSTGVGAVLEAVRAIQARGPIERDLVVLLTDAEELGLDGARIFFGGHPLRDRIGAVVNLEARGGGGRAAMFETGREAGPTVDLFRRAAARADGGTTATSLAVFMYEQMPNGTDFTIPKDRGVGGLNFAFIGRPAQYHSADATPANLDLGALQHLGSQALEAADALLRAPALPAKGPNTVYADVFGRWMLSHSAATGWGLLGLTALLGGFAAWRARRGTRLNADQIGRGKLDGLWFLSAGLVLAQAVRLLAGPAASRATSSETYYVLLRRLPWMEAGAVLSILALALLFLTDARRSRPRAVAGAVAVLTLLVLLIGGFSPIMLGAGLIAAALSLWPVKAPASTTASTWGGWLGLIALVFLLGCMVQGFAPEAALLFVWPALLAATAAALAALISPDLTRPASLIPTAVAGVVGGAWLMGLGHFVFLGVGMDLPGALALIGLLVLLFLRPLSPHVGAIRPVLIGAAACLVLACGLSLVARFVEPTPAVAEALP